MGPDNLNSIQFSPYLHGLPPQDDMYPRLNYGGTEENDRVAARVSIINSRTPGLPKNGVKNRLN